MELRVTIPAQGQVSMAILREAFESEPLPGTVY